MADKTPYEVLGLSEDCSFKNIKHHYRTLARQFHPDVNKDPDAEKMFESVRAAYDFLMANHVESIGVQAAQTIEELLKANRMRKAAAQREQEPEDRPPPGMTRKVGVKQESLVDALKRWGQA